MMLTSNHVKWQPVKRGDVRLDKVRSACCAMNQKPPRRALNAANQRVVVTYKDVQASGTKAPNTLQITTYASGVGPG